MLPKLIDLGGWFLPTYGVLVAIAFLVAIWLTGKLAVRAGLDGEKITNLAVYCAISGMLGAKLFMFLFDWQEYLSNPAQIFSLETLQAAGVYQGGLIVALITAYVYMRKTGLPVLASADIFAPGLALGHGLGRLGCLAAGCCWGTECHLPWAITFTREDAHQLTGVPLNVPLHPTQLYESICELFVFLFLWRYINQTHRSGTVIGWYLVLYSVLRFLIEFLRNHEQSLIAGLSLTQWISMATLFVGAWLLMRPATASATHQQQPKIA
ncbi:MAG: prolipoprotein diacylglyceryl transferase [Bryobacteraceae bacterium]|nr:prolipoprotein diacylglyceryl transferase [Bryobacteraceae bacterium]